MTLENVVIGTRGSRLALTQTDSVKSALERARPGLRVTVKPIVTSGDRTQEKDAPLAGKVLFVQEIEDQLLEGLIDLAVHSMKDMPAELPAGLRILAVPAREQPHDVLLTRDGQRLASLRPGAVIGTSSVRRRAQILASRGDLVVRDLRGNVDTRVRKLLAGEYDGIVLAQAGLTRMGFPDLALETLPPQTFLPAPGQGALAVEGRDDDAMARLVAPLDDPQTAICTTSERAFMRRLGGSCHVPIGALARFEGSMLELDGMVASLDGMSVLRSTLIGDPTDANGIGIRLAQALLALGADDLIGRDGIE